VSFPDPCHQQSEHDHHAGHSI